MRAIDSGHQSLITTTLTRLAGRPGLKLVSSKRERKKERERRTRRERQGEYNSAAAKHCNECNANENKIVCTYIIGKPTLVVDSALDSLLLHREMPHSLHSLMAPLSHRRRDRGRGRAADGKGNDTIHQITAAQGLWLSSNEQRRSALKVTVAIVKLGIERE